MGQDIIPYEPYHPHFAYTLFLTVLAWLAVLWFTANPRRATPRQRAWLLVLTIALPIYAEAMSYLIFLLRPAPDTLIGYWMSHVHIRYVEPLRIDWFLSEGALIGLIALICLLGSASLMRFTLGTWRLRQRLADAVPIEQTAFAELAMALRDLAPNHQQPPLALLRDTAPLAFTTGLVRPRIYVTTGLLELLAADEIQAVLCHELAHAIRRDNLINVLVRLVRDIAFFLPGSWALWRAMMATEDEACDQLAVELTKEPLALARALVKVAGAWQNHQGPKLPIVTASAFAAHDEGPTRRVQQMLRLHDAPTGRVPHGARLLALALLVLAVLPSLLGS